MEKEILKIRGMVCGRCITAVEKLLAQYNLPVKKVSLGLVTFERLVTEKDLHLVQQHLPVLGFEVISDKQARIVAEIKETIQEIFDQMHPPGAKLKFSELFQEKFHLNYDTVSAYFSEVEGITLEKYIVEKKLEKVKELLVYTELTLSEIAYRLGYSSVHYLSSQFKKVTGLVPSHFRTVKAGKTALSGDRKSGTARARKGEII